MIAILITILFQLAPTLPALESPTPMPTAQGAIFITPQAMATPTFIPTFEATVEIPSTTVPRSEVYSFLATTAYEVNQLPEQIDVVNGVSVLPDEEPSLLFGYMKWLFSPNITKELLGENFAILGDTLFVILVLAVTFGALYLLVYSVVMTIRFISWVYKKISDTIPG